MLDITNFILSKKLLNKLVSHAKKSAPKESVAIISGKILDDQAIAEKVYTPENIDQSTVTFTVEPMLLYKIYTDIEKEEKTLIGIYHTHPAPPYPSATDKKYMDLNRVIWLISSTATPDKPKGYILTDQNNLKEVVITIE